MNINKDKIIKICKIIIALIIALLVLKEFTGIIASFDIKKFRTYADRLSLEHTGIILILGIISYAPLTLYDFILKKKVHIDLDNKKLFKFSWIASSISSIAGFGGSTAIALKSNFYKEYTTDSKLLVKEISRIIVLNLTGFSMTCVVYVITNLSSLKLTNFSDIITIIISLYLPIVVGYLAYKYIKDKVVEKIYVKYDLQIMMISILEWITTIVLIYSILLILDINIGFMKFLPIFVVSIVIAIISMSPGGIGSFDLTLIVGLSAFGISSEKVLLAIFLYRVSYYLIPLIIGLILYSHELLKKIDKNIINIITEGLSKIAHIGLIILVLLSGMVLLINEAIPDIINNIDIVRKVSNLSIMYVTDKISIIIGFLLITIASLLIHKSKDIYKITLILITIGSIMTIIQDHEYTRIIYTIIVGVILWISKKQFYRERFVMRWSIFIQDIIVLLSFEVLYLYIVYLNLSGTVSEVYLSNHRIQEIHSYGISILIFSIVGFLISILFLSLLFYRNRLNEFPKLKLSECEKDINSTLKKFNGTSVIHFVYLNDKYVYFNKDKDVFVQYQIFSDKMVILGNPVGNPQKIFDMLEELYSVADKYGYTPVFCAIDKHLIPHLHELGYEFMKLGEEATVNLEKFTLEGRKMKSVRNALSRVSKENYSFEIVKPPFSNEFMDSIKDISDEWLGNKPEKGFSVGFFDYDYLNREPIAIVKNKDNEIKGFTNIMPMYDDYKTLSIDLMRFSRNTCNGIMDFMFVNLFKWGKEHGYYKFNMGMVPLSNVGISKYAFIREKLAYQVYLYGQYFYSFQGLKKFKEKYCESWDGRYMAYKKRSPIVITMLEVILLVSKTKKI